MASPIDGRATAVLVKLGDKVKAGQPLIQLSSPHVGQLQADAQKALPDLSVAEKAIERVAQAAGGRRGLRQGGRAGRGRLPQGQVRLRARDRRSCGRSASRRPTRR